MIPGKASLIDPGFLSKQAEPPLRIRVVIPYRAQPAGLHLLIDSTGVKMLGEGEW